MPAHLRVSVADRPGALAALTRALAAAGANVQSVTVLQRESGRAVDDLLLEWPFERPWDAVVRAIDGCAGARLHGLRHVPNVAHVHDADVVVQLLAQPDRAVETLVDTLPGLMLADWAAIADHHWPRDPVYGSVDAPEPLPATPVALPRARSLLVGDTPLVVLPCTDDLRLLVGRTSNPGFTRTELDRCAALARVALEIVRLAPDYASANSATTRPN